MSYYYPDLLPGFVSRVYPVDPKDRRLYVDAVPADLRSICLKAPVFLMPGFKRNLRNGAQVLIGYFNGNPQTPFVLGHSPNSDTSSTYNQDPLAPALENVGDLVIEHPETGAFIRLRDANATSTSPSSVDGGPVTLEFTLRSGMQRVLSEYNPPGYPQAPPPAPTDGSAPEPLPTPPKPPRAKDELLMPSGASVIHDEPAVGESTHTTTSAQGLQDVHDDTQKQVRTLAGQTQQTLDAKANRIVHEAGAQIQQILDGARQQISHLAGDARTVIDGELNVITHLAGAAQTVIDGEADQIAHIAQAVGLGDFFANLQGSSNAALNLSHLTTFENSLQIQRLADAVKVVTAIAPYLTNGAAAIAAVQALVMQHIKLPAGSGTVRIKS